MVKLKNISDNWNKPSLTEKDKLLILDFVCFKRKGSTDLNQSAINSFNTICLLEKQDLFISEGCLRF